MTRILVIDDSPTEMARFREVLTKNNLTILEARNGEQGIQMAIDEQPDLVLMDVVMPEMNGFQATRKITRNKATSHIPVIIVSTKNQETDRVWGKRQGAKEYLTKPFNESELLQVIQRVKPAGGSPVGGSTQQQARPKQTTVQDIRSKTSSKQRSSDARVQVTAKQQSNQATKQPSQSITGNVSNSSIHKQSMQTSRVQTQQIPARGIQSTVTGKAAPKPVPSTPPVAPKPVPPMPPVVPKQVAPKPVASQSNPKPDDADDNGIYL